MKIIGFDGSPKRGGETTKQLKKALSEAKKAGAKTEYVFIRPYAKLFHGDFDKNLAPSMQKLIDKIMEADGVIFATPVHWFAPSGFMKCLIDALSYLEDYAGTPKKEPWAYGKVAGFIAVYGEDGGQMAIAQMSAAAVHSGFTIPPWGFVFYNKHIASHSCLKWQLTASKELGKEMVNTAQLIS